MKQGPSLTFRLTVYPLVLLFFVIFSALVVFFAAGYNIKFEDGRLITQKTGIIIVSTRPGEALVTLDGEVQPQKTPSLQIFNLKIKRVVSGTHRLVVSKEGYETWEGDVVVDPGLVSWRNYLVLIPLERKADSYNFPGSVESSVVSKDRRRMIVFAADRTQNVYNLLQVNTENKTSQKIAEGLLVAGESFNLLGLSGDNNKLLYKKTDSATKKISYLVQDLRENGPVYDLSSLFSNQAGNYHFSPYNDNELFFTQANGLYRINLEDKTQSAVLVNDVIGAYSLEDQLLTIRKVEDNYGLWLVNDKGETRNIIKAIPAAVSYRVTYLKGSKSYLVQGDDDKDLLLFSTETEHPTLETIARNVTLFVPSPQGASIAIYSENQIRVFEIEERKYYNTLATEGLVSLDWLRDDKNLVYSTDKHLGTINYNGDYNKSLFAVSAQVTTSYLNHNLFFINIAGADRDLHSFSL